MTATTQMQLIIDQLNTAVLSFDHDLHLKYINPAGEMLLATSARLIIGHPVNELFVNTPEFIRSLQQALTLGRPYSERELHLTLSNMQSITVNCTVSLIDDPRHEQALLLELFQMDRQLRIAREENLLAQNNTIKALIRGMAHEIKNPLGGLRGAAQLLERELPDESLKEYTQVIIGEADRLQNLLNRMLGPNRLPRKQMINIHVVLERVRTLVQAEAPGGIQIVRDYDPSIPDIYADQDQLIQALLNIVRNAIQALGDSGEITLRSRSLRQVTLGQQYHRLVVKVDVIDNGPGIPDDIQENIFYPMVTGRAEGTGLGLPIAQSLINQHGGLIECSRKHDKTIFTLYLPLEKDNEQ